MRAGGARKGEKPVERGRLGWVNPQGAVGQTGAREKGDGSESSFLR